MQEFYDLTKPYRNEIFDTSSSNKEVIIAVRKPK